MNNKKTREYIKQARAAHQKWFSNIRFMVSTMNIEEGRAALLPTECDFGLWYYGEGQALRKNAAFQTLESAHDDVHCTYMRILKVVKRKSKKSLATFFTQSTIEDEIKQLMLQLEEQSNYLRYILEILEEDVI